MRQLLGYILTGIGILFVLATYSGMEFGIDKLWPAFLLIPAIGFHLFYFLKPSPARSGVLVPGGILLVYALLFFFSEIVLDGDMSKTWPIFLLGPAFGLWELYFFGFRKIGLLIPIMLLTAIAFIFLACSFLSTQIGGIFGVVLVAIGGSILSRKKKHDYTF
ncbi:hypothetical protein EDM56_11610 [Brevibacillus fluminis]|uniref:DUF5668 domain-containing protein n=1 Tax=Brevibacillus fluminis TaxID=511487 RepID=A0A3M8DP42_9BACL|nr:hypothetical protein [Brevibacillus fluminis]RNB89804.1 hypothetical protein EDM56_11610 [Brevibacillus fluminis]